MNSILMDAYDKQLTDQLKYVPFPTLGGNAVSRKTKIEVRHDVEFEFTVKGDDQTKVLDVLSRLRDELDDIKFSKIEARRYETSVYVD